MLSTWRLVRRLAITTFPTPPNAALLHAHPSQLRLAFCLWPQVSHSWGPRFPGCVELPLLACQPGGLSKRGDWRSCRYLSRSGDGASEQLPSGPPGQACSSSQRSSGVRLVGSEGALASAEAVTHFSLPLQAEAGCPALLPRRRPGCHACAQQVAHLNLWVPRAWVWRGTPFFRVVPSLQTCACYRGWGSKRALPSVQPRPAPGEAHTTGQLPGWL